MNYNLILSPFCPDTMEHATVFILTEPTIIHKHDQVTQSDCTSQIV